MSNQSQEFCNRTRREFLWEAGAGFTGVALTGLLGADGFFNQPPPAKKPAIPLAPKQPMTPARAKSVIFLFMYGGPSQVDTFDPKPDLVKYHGKTMKEALPSAGEIKAFFGGSNTALMKSPFAFQKYGKSGIEVSELFPHLAQR